MADALTGAGVQTSAQPGTISFTSTSGISGTLDLGTEKAALD
jgi:hypothetical protein